MASAVPEEVTGLLLAWSQGDHAAPERLVPVVYRELRRLAHGYMRRVNEAYQRLIHTLRVRRQDRAHFFAVCAQLMRRILVDHARGKGYQKRGGEMQVVSLDKTLIVSGDAGPLAIDEALGALTAMDVRMGRIVELRFFGGLTVAETAEALQISPKTVMRDWKLAKAWLMRELAGRNARGA